MQATLFGIGRPRTLIRRTPHPPEALFPGALLATKMVREVFGAPQGPVSIGIEAELYPAMSADLEGVTGPYFDCTSPVRATPHREPQHRQEAKDAPRRAVVLLGRERMPSLPNR